MSPAGTPRRQSAWRARPTDCASALAALDAEAVETASAATGAAGATPDQLAAIEQWERRVVDLRTRRDTVAADLAAADRVRRDAEAARAAAEAGAATDGERLARAERELDSVADRRRTAAAAAATAVVEATSADAAVVQARTALDALLASDETDRTRLAEAEARAREQRVRLHAAEDRSRASEAADLQARLELDLIREQALVELAALGDLGLTALQRAGVTAADDTDVGIPVMAPADDDRGEDRDVASDAVAFEAALDAAAARWVRLPPPVDPPTNARVAALRRRYHELGAANPFAVSEYAEVRSRLEALDSQDRDLREAIGATRRLIAELNTLIADQFRTTFHALEGAFDTRFRQLFGGGYAKLSLTDPEDLSTTGVEIVARPPGKKLQALAMLSGGERALTAVALLFAMLEVRPVPFCVLDEVDAALDEANVGRFTDALRGLAASTQFVVITHNRGTIEAADALYGVTVGEDSVSRVISLRLDEATALAARSPGAADREPELAAAG